MLLNMRLNMLLTFRSLICKGGLLVTLFDRFKTFENVSFREIYRHFLYIDCREALEELFPQELEDNISGMAAYCYIDPEQGISPAWSEETMRANCADFLIIECDH
jgi:hypothetical protein